MVFFHVFDHSIGFGGALMVIKISEESSDIAQHFPQCWSTCVDLLVNKSTCSVNNVVKKRRKPRYFDENMVFFHDFDHFIGLSGAVRDIKIY